LSTREILPVATPLHKQLQQRRTAARNRRDFRRDIVGRSHRLFIASGLTPVTTPNTSRDSAQPLANEIEFRVRYAETDQMGVVYHTNYLVWCEMGRTDFIRTCGKSYAELERAGIGLAVSELSVRYHAAAKYDDMIRVRTTLADVKSRLITFDYVIFKAETGARLVTARTTLVSIDSSGRPMVLPPSVRALFEPR
jgi:acyl-CoA thioester hydrolase